jgi:hypothetical protein
VSMFSLQMAHLRHEHLSPTHLHAVYYVRNLHIRWSEPPTSQQFSFGLHFTYATIQQLWI